MVKLIPVFRLGALPDAEGPAGGPADGPAAEGPAIRPGIDDGAPAWLACWATWGCEPQPPAMVKLVPAFLRGALPDADGPADGPAGPPAEGSAADGPAIGAGVDVGAPAWLGTGMFLRRTVLIARRG